VKFYSLANMVILHIIFIMISPDVFAAQNSEVVDKVLKVGVRSHSGIEATKAKWTKTIDVLTQSIRGYHFELVPIVGFPDMRTAAKNKKVDFILTNPLAYTELNKQSGLTRLLTLNKKQPDGIASTTFASVIFSRSDRSDIQNLDDVINNHIMGVDEEAFGGWKMALREFSQSGIDLYEYAIAISFSADNTHQTVVKAVLDGQVDIGVVRTGIIEQLEEQGKIKLSSIKVLNSHNDGLSALHSTQHYPEWPFSVMPHVPDDISNEVFHVLLTIQHDSPAALAGRYLNWAAPLDYSEVYNLSNDLEQRHITLAKLWERHWLAIVIALFFVIAMVIYTVYLFSINKKLMFAKHELGQHRNYLEEVIEKRTEELVLEKSKAEDANKAKSDFLSNMSHELRTPLNAILGFGQLMKMDAEDARDEVLSENVDEILDAGKYLLSLINEVLDLAKIESGKVELVLEEVRCNEVLKQSLDIISPLSSSKNISINIDNCSECLVTADRKRLQQVLINLLSNAVKYNNHDGNINIYLEKNDRNSCKFRIKDSGLGIKPEFHDQVFEPFLRDEENVENIEGTGVGLVITKHLVEQMQGMIGFESEYGLGTEFWIELPAAQLAEE